MLLVVELSTVVAGASKRAAGPQHRKGAVETRAWPRRQDVGKGQSKLSWVGISKESRVRVGEHQTEWHEHGGI